MLIPSMLTGIVRAQTVSQDRYAQTIDRPSPDPGGPWFDEGEAEGNPGCDACDCNDTSGVYAYNNVTSDRTWLHATAIGNFSIDPNFEITSVTVDIMCRFNTGTTDDIDWDFRVPGVRPFVASPPSERFASNDGNCRYRLGNGGDISSALGRPWTLADLNAIEVRIRRADTNSTNLRVRAFRVRVEARCPPVVAPSTASSAPPNVCYNDTGNITLSASGGQGGAYVWYAGGCGAGASIGSGQQILIPSPDITTTYFVRIESPCAAPSGCASVMVPVIPAPVAPSSISVDRSEVCASDPGTITLTAHGGSGDTLCWYSGSCGGTFIQCSVNPLVINSPTTSTDYYARYQRCAVDSGCATVRVTVVPTPVMPASCSATPPVVCQNYTGMITLAASGAANGTVRWYRNGCGNGSAIGEGASIMIQNPGVTSSYYCRTESTLCPPSACCRADVSVETMPGPITGASSSRARVCANDVGTITLTASGGAGGVIQWTANGAPIGNTNPLTVPSPKVTTTYTACVASPQGTCVPPPPDNCATTVIIVDPDTAIDDQPIDQVAAPGGTATFCVTESPDSRNCTFQWYHNGEPIPDEDDRCLIIDPVSFADGGAYHVVLNCDCGPATSDTAFLTVCNIAASPVEPIVIALTGKTTILRITASGDGPFTYLWRKDYQPITDGRFGGVTTPMLTINDTMLGDAGDYDCLVSNACTPPPDGLPSRPPIMLDVFCFSDFNRDRIINSQDFFDFVNALFEGDIRANINMDCCINSQDFFDFLTAFFAGC